MSEADDLNLEDETEDGDDEESQAPTGFKNYMTPLGEAQIKKEIHELRHVERPELVKTVAWAASNGDRSENADYIYGKRRLRQIDSRLRFLKKRLQSAEIVDPLKQSGPKVLFGATVTIQNEVGQKKTYSIVGIDEIDLSKGKISWKSPLGSALLQSEEGETVSFSSPKGEEDIEILKVEYKEIK